jgi:hypothetical protein
MNIKTRFQRELSGELVEGKADLDSDEITIDKAGVA